MERRHVLEEDHQHQALKERVDWKSFRPLLEEVFGLLRNCGQGRRPWDDRMILRSILLGVMNGLSDEP